MCAQCKLKVPCQSVKPLGRGGHVPTARPPRGQLKRTRLGPCQQQSARWRHCHCSRVLLRPPRDAAMPTPISTDIVPRAAVADRSRFDAIIIVDGCLVRTASVGVRPQSSHCADRLSRARVADSCRSVASIIGLVCRERPSSRQLLGEAWRAPGLDGRIACGCATVRVRLVDARRASGRPH